MKRSLSILCSLLLAACATEATSIGDDEPSPDAMVDPPDPDPTVVNFQSQIVPIFNRSCGTGTAGCHGRDAYGANSSMDCRGWLALEDAPLGAQFYAGDMAGQPTGCPDITLYQRLMSLDVWQCSTPTAYVVPGDPGGSYIMHKVEGQILCRLDANTVSEPMPPPQPSQMPFTISTADKALIQQWIVEGALDN